MGRTKVPWNIPYPWNPNFTGRETLLEQLHTALQSAQPAALTQAIYGLGGVGKTQVAVEYAYRHAAEYQVVWWVRAEDPTTLAADYADLARVLDLPEHTAAEQAVTVEAVRRWLEHHIGWLLIFDNVTDRAELRAYHPRGATGHLIVTSRNPNWRGTAQPLLVEELPRAEAVEFLVKRTGQDDRAAAAALADALGDLPLALAQAGAYIEATGRSLRDYMQLFQSHPQELWARGQPEDYPATVATTWDLAFQQLPSAATDLLHLCAFFAPEDIPLDMLSQAREHLPEPLASVVADPMTLDDSVAALRRYSLMDRHNGSLSIHRIVQAITLDRLSQPAKQHWAAAAVRVVDAVFPSEGYDVRTWAECAALLPHALTTTEHAEGLGSALEATSRLLLHVAGYLRGRAEFRAAKAALERALQIEEAVHGPKHPAIAGLVHNLGMLLHDLGDFEGARTATERALRIGEAVYSPDHPAIALTVTELGNILHSLGDLEGARTATERALRIGEAVYSPDHPAIAAFVTNLGNILSSLGELEGARAAYERALRIDEAVYGPNHPDVAQDVSNLGTVLQELGDLKGARAAHERALRIDEAVYGPDHPAIANIVNGLGNVLRALGDLEGARAATERALRIDEAVYGPDHPDVARDVHNLGTVLQELGDLKGARAAFERAVAVSEQHLGPNHPTTQRIRANLAALGPSAAQVQDEH